MNPDDMGRDEGDERGPEAGKGAVVHDQSGEADFDGLAGDQLPPQKAVKKKLDEERHAPPDQNAD
jgi:hypothetical protein